MYSLQFGRWSTVLFHYYLLGGDTVALSGLLAMLCHAFLVVYCYSLDIRVMAQVLSTDLHVSVCVCLSVCLCVSVTGIL